MVAASAICWPDQYGLSQKEKENDHFGKKFEDKLGRKFPSDDVSGASLDTRAMLSLVKLSFISTLYRTAACWHALVEQSHTQKRASSALATPDMEYHLMNGFAYRLFGWTCGQTPAAWPILDLSGEEEPSSYYAFYYKGYSLTKCLL